MGENQPIKTGRGSMPLALTIEEQPPLPEVKLGETLFYFYQRDDIAAFADEFYTDTPVKLNVFMDSWNKADVDFEDEKTITAVFEAMKVMPVVEVSEEFYTDNYNCLTFYMADGSEFSFNFNYYNLDYDGVYYKIVDEDGLWTLLREIIRRTRRWLSCCVRP